MAKPIRLYQFKKLYLSAEQLFQCMNKLFRFIFMSLLLVSFSSCNEKAEPEDDSKYAPITGPEEDGKEEDQVPDTLKIMSFNIRTGTSDKNTVNAWDTRKKGVYEMLNTEKPLIVGLQECHIFQRTDILNNCPSYNGFGIGRDGSSTSGESCSIIYDRERCSIEKWGYFWLSETPDRSSMGWDAAYKRIATWAIVKLTSSEKRFFFINTHLDNKGATAQSEGMKLIMRKFEELNPEKLPQVLVADFNQVQTSTIFNECTDTMDNARLKAAKTDSKGTYNNWGSSSKMIDHIFMSGYDIHLFKTLDQQWGSIRYISDHYPIYVLASFK